MKFKEENSLNSKQNVNSNYYETRGSGPQHEGLNDDDYKHSLAQGTTQSTDTLKVRNSSRDVERNESAVDDLAGPSRLQRLKRLRKTRGLSARQLMERKMSRRATRRHKPRLANTGVSVTHSAT